MAKNRVVFLNPATCGIYKDGGTRYQINAITGRRSTLVDNEMAVHVERFLGGDPVPGSVEVPLTTIHRTRVLVPKYYDLRWNEDFQQLLRILKVEAISLGDLEDSGILKVKSGHGSPSNDVRTGMIPYVKVSDIRALRVNINPTNLVPMSIARRFWKGESSGLEAWDLVSPNRASSNIGEFAVLLPGEEQVVLTKEMFVFRLNENKKGWTPFYLHWCLCLKAVRKQWQRITLMQTNREDVGNRYREILLPIPKNSKWAQSISAPFERYFGTLATARTHFVKSLADDGFEYIASAKTTGTAQLEESPIDDIVLEELE